MVEAQRDTARRSDYQHLKGPDVLWTGAILADRAQKDCQERPLNRRDFLLDDLIGSGLYDSNIANSFLERSQCYTATCVSALYDHVVDMKHEVTRLFPRVDRRLTITFRMQHCFSVQKIFVCGSWSRVVRLGP